MGTVNILEFCRQTGARLLFLSSVAASAGLISLPLTRLSNGFCSLEPVIAPPRPTASDEPPAAEAKNGSFARGVTRVVSKERAFYGTVI